MTTTSFGRRGTEEKVSRVLRDVGFTEPSPARAPRPAPSQRLHAEAATAPTSLDAHEIAFDGVLDRIPILTVGIILMLCGVFVLQKQVAFDTGAHGRMSYESVLALGAASRDLVLGHGEIWRLALAPMLHSDSHHLLGNAFALLMVGVGLESVIGRGWFGAAYVAAALTGVLGSLYGNPTHIVTLGASGAITGIIGAAFVMSFSWRTDPDLRRKMRRAALFFGVPAILPLAFGASGGTDYWAHFGGALGGMAVALAVVLTWSGASHRPPGAALAGRVAAAAVALPVIAALFSAVNFGSHAARAAEMIPQKQMPSKIEDMATRSADLVARYPKDPRGHLFLGLAHLYGKRVSQAELEFRAVLAKTPNDPTSVFLPARNLAQTYLALTLAQQKRVSEAKTTAATLCRSRTDGGARLLLDAAKLCG